MKNYLILISLVILLSCRQSTSFDDVSEFSTFVVNCLKSNNIDNAPNLWISKEETIDLLKTFNYTDSQMAQCIKTIDMEEKLGTFNEDSIKIKFTQFRNTIQEDFWKNCKIDSIYNIEPKKMYKSTTINCEAMVTLSRGNSFPKNLKIGELIKTKNGWKITRGPFWK